MNIFINRRLTLLDPLLFPSKRYVIFGRSLIILEENINESIEESLKTFPDILEKKTDGNPGSISEGTPKRFLEQTHR